jgi:two-component system chemotaxis response regulator CheY
MESAPSSSAPASNPAPSIATGPTLRPSTILLVEYDKLSQRLATVSLSSLGHEVLVAGSIAEAMVHLRKNPLVDLVVLENQIGLEKGASLIGEMRRQKFLADIPITVYTETRDRDVVRRYLELGVQGFHLKPYKVETLVAELERAHAKGRRENLIEPPEVACRRLKVTLEQYAGLLNSGAGAVEECCQTVRRLLLSAEDSRVSMAFRSMAKQLNQLGVHIIDKLGAQAEDELRKMEYSACTDTLGTIDNVAMFLRRRALDYLAVGNSVVNGVPGGTLVPFGQRKTSNAPMPLAHRDTSVAPYVRAILSQSIGSFGAQSILRIMEAPFAGGELTPSGYNWTNHPSVILWLDVVSWLHDVENYAENDVISALESLRGFETTIEAVLNRTEGTTVSAGFQVDHSFAVKKLGVVKGAILVAAGRLGRGGLNGNIPLGLLRQHAIALLLTGYEFARLLKITLPHKVAIAALLDKLGLWTVAVNEPLLAALALARTQHMSSALEAEEEVLGIGFGEAGAKWIKAAGVSNAELYMDTARGTSSVQENEVTVALVQAVKQLAVAASHGDTASLNVVADVMRAPDYPLWQTLRRHGIPLPAESVEIVDLILPMAKSVVWITDQMLGQRSNS